MENQEMANSDKELYTNRVETGQCVKVFLTGYDEVNLKYGGLGIQFGGTVVVKQPHDWVELVEELDRYRIALAEARARIDKLQAHICDLSMDKMKG
jgi:hypothetical protein